MTWWLIPIVFISCFMVFWIMVEYDMQNFQKDNYIDYDMTEENDQDGGYL